MLNAYKKRFECQRQWGTHIDPLYAYGVEGFFAFHAEVGDVPVGMRCPTIGRKDHAKGYEPGNMFWDEDEENAREAINRNRGKMIEARAAAKALKLAAGLPLRVETKPRKSRRGADRRRIAAEKAAAAVSQGA